MSACRNRFGKIILNLEKAKRLADCNSELSFGQALYGVFGDFSICYELDGVETDLNINIDVNQLMYDLLEG